MNFPINIEVFGAEVSTHLVAEILAFFIGIRFYVYLKKKKGDQDPFTSEQRLIVLIAATVGALIFSRLVGALENVDEWMSSDAPFVYLYATKTVAGGFIGGWLFVEITKYFMGLKSSTGDLMVYPIIVALIIGRIGCFSQGVYDATHGLPTNWITGMNMGDGIERHPLALYEIGVLILIGTFLYFKNKKHPLKDGVSFKVMMLSYLTYRFIAEWMKPSHPLMFGLTSIQLAIILTYIMNLRVFLPLLKNKINE